MNERSKFFPSLKKLTIIDCQNFEGWWKPRNYDYEVGDTIAAELPQFPCLSSLVISNCPRLIHLPFFPTLDDKLSLKETSCTEAFIQTIGMHISSGERGDERSSSGDSTTAGLANLRELILSGLHDLEYIGIEESTSLETVLIQNCLNLKSWLKNKDNENTKVKSPKFLTLSKLAIIECGNFTFSGENNAMEILNPEAFPITNLTHLWLKNLPYLEFICIEAMPFLTGLRISDCPNLKGLGKEWKGYVCKVPGVTETELPHFPCLETLLSERCLKLSSLPPFPFVRGELIWSDSSKEALEKLMKVTSSFSVHPLSKLNTLWIENMEDIESLPPIQHLKSLKSLHIGNCPKLKALPEGMNQLTCLEELDISGCHLLRERCERDKGVDWPYIANIPTIRINHRYRPRGRGRGRYKRVK